MTIQAAIYARKSNERKGELRRDLSVTRRVENARSFAALSGWTVSDSHVYVDDGISGAEFANRPAFMRMMSALTPKPPFSHLVVSEQKSIGREMSETQFVIKQFGQAGVQIFETYAHGQSLTPKNWLEKAMSAMRSAADEAHREDTRIRVHESHTRLHRLGRVTGGRIFGYRNNHVYNGQDQHGNPIRSHTERVIDPIQAEVVVRIFELFASGVGLKGIAKRLNNEHAPFPKPFVRKDPNYPPPVNGWSPSTIQGVVKREIYKGVLYTGTNRASATIGARRIRNDDLSRSGCVQINRTCKSSQMISGTGWHHVEPIPRVAHCDSQMAASAAVCPSPDGVQNLLAGLATCGLCGGGLGVETSPRKAGSLPPLQVCLRHRHTGSCGNALRISVQRDERGGVEGNRRACAHTSEAVEHVIQLAQRDDAQEHRDSLEHERKDCEKRIARLTNLIADS